MAEPAKVFEDRVKAGQWRVEWFDDDGRCEMEIFVGPTARRDALRYAMQNYGHFEEVQLEPYPPDLPVRCGPGVNGCAARLCNSVIAEAGISQYRDGPAEDSER